jgi:sortase (surface protein transpeptidase)
MTRHEPEAAGIATMGRAVVALAMLLAASLGAACSTAGGVSRDGANRRPTRSTTPSSSSASPSSTRPPAPTSTTARIPRYRPSTPLLSSAAPVRLDIPSIGVSTSLVPLGLNPDGTMQVPAKWEEAGWYARGPKPGEDGPAVIAGHVDSTSGPAVFYRLRDLHAGDKVVVTRADHSVVRFVIDRVQQFPKRTFPSAAVFAPTSRPALRLITCTGAFDETLRSYLDNLVAFASPAA